MKVLVTGASGFLGRYVCEQLVERGHETGALVRRVGSEPEGSLAVAGDLTDSSSLTLAMKVFEPVAMTTASISPCLTTLPA